MMRIELMLCDGVEVVVGIGSVDGLAYFFDDEPLSYPPL